jgi:hypothetical protein
VFPALRLPRIISNRNAFIHGGSNLAAASKRRLRYRKNRSKLGCLICPSEGTLLLYLVQTCPTVKSEVQMSLKPGSSQNVCVNSPLGISFFLL